MQKLIRYGVFLISCFFLGTTAFAAEDTIPNPTPFLENISNQMIAALKESKASMEKNPTIVIGIVNRILLPHADLEAMARSALGRDAWMSSTKQQQTHFIKAFTDLMIRTYAAGLSSYTDERVEFMPIRGGLQPGQTRVEVQSRIIRTDGPAISVSYRLIYKNNSWLVYDFSVEGISMIQSFRSQFAAELSSGVDVADLTKKLEAHNDATKPQDA